MSGLSSPEQTSTKANPQQPRVSLKEINLNLFGTRGKDNMTLAEAVEDALRARKEREQRRDNKK